MTTRSGRSYKTTRGDQPRMSDDEGRAPTETEAEGGSQTAMVELLREQRAMMDQQRAQQALMTSLIDQQREEMARYRRELEELRTQREATAVRPKVPKPTLQKLNPKDDIEHFLATFERIAEQQAWPQDVWATQLAGLLTGKAMAAYASMSPEDSGDYTMMKKAILRRYDVTEETHRLRFRKDRRDQEESYREWADRLRDHFAKWTKGGDVPVIELMLIEQFVKGAPDHLAVWLKERKPQSLQQAAELADDYATARKGDNRPRPQTGTGYQPTAQGDKKPSWEQSGGGFRQRTQPQTMTPPRSKTNARGRDNASSARGGGICRTIVLSSRVRIRLLPGLTVSTERAQSPRPGTPSCTRGPSMTSQ